MDTHGTRSIAPLGVCLVLLIACDDSDGASDAGTETTSTGEASSTQGTTSAQSTTVGGDEVPVTDEGTTDGADVDGSDSGTLSDESSGSDSGTPLCPEPGPYATELVAFQPGFNAGFGREGLPDVVLGPPQPGPPRVASLDVLSLGTNGEIVLGFGDQSIYDGEGPDFIVWENPFWINGDPAAPFAELGEVAVSQDGEQWYAYPCDPTVEQGYDPGCAGWRARQEFDPCEVPLDPDSAGGDPFDLADLGLESIRFVRIRDLSTTGKAPSAGFDLDAIGAVYLQPRG